MDTQKPMADSQGNPAELPAEVLEILHEIEAEEVRCAEMSRECHLEPSALDAETQKWFNLERAWTRWARRQTNERLAEPILRLAAFFLPQTENHALLFEAAERLTKERRKRRNRS